LPFLTEKNVVEKILNIAGKEPAYKSTPNKPDIIIEKEDEVFIIEVKTGNPKHVVSADIIPELKAFDAEAEYKYPDKEVNVILVTNRKVPEFFRRVIGKYSRIRLVDFDSLDNLKENISPLITR